MSDITEREAEILKCVHDGSHSPTELAKKLGISLPGASQALQKLANKGKLSKRKAGRRVLYETASQHKDNENFFLAQATNLLAQVWAYILSMDLSDEETKRARTARDVLENTLARKKA
ncbi:MAG TPA: winged helix-turn-helix domain-containing protein [Nitrososphaerales archaeon]|nr:winged helix-turn-helix domain-containing protein [Nitrososphaerales archaeon]